MKILMIDDEPFFARAYVDKLVQTGHQVDLVTDAAEAFQKLQGDLHYNIIILDVMMPPPEGAPESEVNSGLDTGIYLLRRLLEVKAQSIHNTPIVILTNRATSHVQEAIASLQIPNTHVRSKMDTPAFYLPRLLKEVARESK